MGTADLPPLPPAIACSITAASTYGLPANMLLAVAEMEGGRPGLWVRNDNGTYDVGPLQFNTAYLKTLEPYGITAQAVSTSGCYPYELAAWRVQKHIREDSGDLWTRAANYHSRTPQLNATYRVGLMRRATRWARWLAGRFTTYEMIWPSTAAEQITPITKRSSAASAPRAAASPRSAVFDSRSMKINESVLMDEAAVPRPITFRALEEGGLP